MSERDFQKEESHDDLHFRGIVLHCRLTNFIPRRVFEKAEIPKFDLEWCSVINPDKIGNESYLKGELVAVFHAFKHRLMHEGVLYE